MDNNSDAFPDCTGHGLPARLWWTKKQPPRQFYRCSKPIGQQCKFFAWVTPEESILSQANVLPPTPDSARPSGQNYPVSPSTPTPAPRNISTANAVLQRNFFHLDATSGSGINGVPKTPAAGPEYSNNSKYGFRSLIGLTGTCSQPNDMPLHDNMVVPSSTQTSQDDGFQEPSSDLVSNMIRQLGTLPEYVMKLKRQKVAADRSREAKNTAIISLQDQVNRLEAEVVRLKAREQELEAIVATFED